MTQPANGVTIIGSYLSPYVRKVLACLHIKGVEYRIDPIVPYFGNDEFSRLSPLRRVPVLIDDLVTLPDSTVICEYLEERYPEPPLLPPEPERRARARWFEEYADSRLGEVFVWKLFNNTVINRYVWQKPVDKDLLEQTIEREIPAILDHLEAEIPPGECLLGQLSIADISVASFFRNASFSGYEIEHARWPRTDKYVKGILSLEAFAQLRPFEELSLRTPISGHRQALLDSGAPLTESTFGVARPRRGVLGT